MDNTYYASLSGTIDEVSKLIYDVKPENLSNEEKLDYAKSLLVKLNPKITSNTEPMSEDDIKYRDNFSNWLEPQLKLLDDSMVIEYVSGDYNSHGQWIRDSINIVRMDDRVLDLSTHDVIYYMSKLFGPVGLMWNKKFNHAASMAATIVRYGSKKELKAFLKENRPLVYILMEHQVYTPKAGIRYTTSFVVDNLAIKTEYICRYFPEVGKLPWWKYQLQFFVNKLPRNKKLRAYFYRLLATS